MPQMSRSENLRQFDDFETVREISRRVSIGPWAVVLLALATGHGGDKARGAEAGLQAGIAVWDTVKPAAKPIASETLTRALTVLGCDLVQFYGTTEACLVTLLRPADHDLARARLLS